MIGQISEMYSRRHINLKLLNRQYRVGYAPITTRWAKILFFI